MSTWNPSDKNASITLSGGDLTATSSAGGFAAVRGATSKTTGKWVFEVHIGSGTNHMVGFANSSQALNTFPGASGNNSVGYYSVDGTRFINGVNTAYGSGFAAGDDVMCCVDADADTCFFIRNGTTYGSINISAVTGALFAAWASNTAAAVTANFGATSFVNTVPSGYSAWDSAGASSDLSGDVTLDAVAPAGTLADGGASSLTGDVTLAAVAPAGTLGVAPGAYTVPALTNWGGSVQAAITISFVTFQRLADGVQVLVLADQVTDGSGNLSGTHAALLAGTTYMVCGWSADGSARFARPVVAA